jgi:hypothetical protein
MRSDSVPISPKHLYGVIKKGNPGSRSRAAGPRSYKAKARLQAKAGEAHCARRGPWETALGMDEDMGRGFVNARPRAHAREGTAICRLRMYITCCNPAVCKIHACLRRTGLTLTLIPRPVALHPREELAADFPSEQSAIRSFLWGG